ncbi:MAG TPA: SIR2 family protein, partial [Iamia sp.]|nr:SIR2 family protein [Iamia sp.]
MGETAGDRIQKIEVEEFVRRLKRLLEGDAQTAWFLGAGTSRSSGIPLAGELTERWLRQLHSEAAPKEPYDDYVARTFPDHDPKDPAASYSDVMTRLFQTAADQQEEIERLVTRHDPGFGYATFAQLIEHAGCGPKCNVVFTTNFDDLVADALYLYTRTRPLVVSHASLADFAASGRTRPTIVKLHGDAMLAPLNDANQLAQLHEAYREVLDRHLRDRALIFLGYGGHDKGVTDALKALPTASIARGVYWVGNRIPDTELGEWLRHRPETFHVPHLDFDELMAVVQQVFDLPHPKGDRFESLLKRYQDTFTTLQGEVDADDTTPEVIRDSVDSARAKFDTWFAVQAEAARYKESDPDRADQIYREGIETFSTSASLLEAYASFLFQVRHDHDNAEAHYRRAIDADPTDAVVLGNYANFLTYVRNDHDAAEIHFRRAIDINPTIANLLGTYASFLRNVRRDHDTADTYFRRALENRPTDPFYLGNHAGLLWGLGRVDEARASWDLVDVSNIASQMAVLGSSAAPSLILEGDIYRLANDGVDGERRTELLEHLRDLLLDGVRTRGWTFEL